MKLRVKREVEVFPNKKDREAERAYARKLFPDLTSFSIIGKEDWSYNCLAYVIGVTDRWIGSDEIFDTTKSAVRFLSNYYAVIPVKKKVKGSKLIALFGFGDRVEHFAISDSRGWWKSKTGAFYVLRHRLKDLEGYEEDDYGSVLKIIRVVL